jgi:hypothetical protein
MAARKKSKAGEREANPSGQRAREDKTLNTAPAKTERIDAIMDLMVSGRWVTGRTGRLLASEWGLALDTVERDSAEASRRIRTLVNEQEREELKARFLAKLEGVLEQSLSCGRFEAAKGILELEGKALGHFEPEKVEVSGNLSELLQLGLASGSKETD